MPSDFIIITPLIRLQNLDTLRDSINLPCYWVIVHDADGVPPEAIDKANKGRPEIRVTHLYKKSERNWVGGYGQRNVALAHLHGVANDDDWIWNFDDDTVMFSGLKDIAEVHSEDLVTFDTIVGLTGYVVPYGQVWAGYDPPRRKISDTGAFIVRWRLMHRFAWETTHCADQHLTRKLWEAAQSKAYHPGQGAWWNYLRSAPRDGPHRW